jgi:glycosyltransferase involved in cell wall biosynthesis
MPNSTSPRHVSGAILVVVPCYNEAAGLSSIVADLSESLADLTNITILLIDDGSSDGTFPEVQRMSESFDNVEYLSFTRNFGKEAAMLAGIDIASSRRQAVLLMDADGQHPAHIARRLIEVHREGYSHVVAQRDRADESRLYRLFARIAYRALAASTRIPFVSGQGDFRVLSPELTTALASLPERNRFSKGLYSWLGSPDIVIEYSAPDIVQYRSSSWRIPDLLDYAIDGITSFNTRPLRWIIMCGLATAGFSTIYAGIAIWPVMRSGIDVPGYVTTIIAVTFLGSIQLISLGIIGEYVGRILSEAKARPAYLVRESFINVSAVE